MRSAMCSISHWRNTFIGPDPIFPRAIRRHFPTVVSTAKQTDRYNLSITLGITIFPSGNTTTNNWLIGPEILECSVRFPAMAKLPRSIHERVKLPNDLWCPIIETATAA
jgi:hypothetical protein